MNNLAPDWFKGEYLPAPGPGKFLLTTRRYPIFYLQITKCGCTFLRNLLYMLDHGTAHPDSRRVHAHNEDFFKADLIPESVLTSSPALFAVIRDPVDRFLSLYFDKIADTQNEADAGMRRRVTRAAKLDADVGDDLEGHRQNCLKTVNWFGRNLDTKDEGKPNPHWQRQSVRLRKIRNLDAHILTLDGLSWQLPFILKSTIPDISEQMAAVSTRNASRRMFSKAEILTDELQSAIHTVYARDQTRYQRISNNWRDLKEGLG